MAQVIFCLLTFFSLCAKEVERTARPEVQRQGAIVFGLTPRSIPLSAAKLKQLAYIGIDFAFNAPLSPNLGVQVPAKWEGGVLFLSDFHQKAHLFRKWLEMAKFRPSKIVIVDDGKTSIK